VAPDGQRLFIVRAQGVAALYQLPVTVIVNWPVLLNR
jgi:hypothetical protein